MTLGLRVQFRGLALSFLGLGSTFAASGLRA